MYVSTGMDVGVLREADVIVYRALGSYTTIEDLPLIINKSLTFPHRGQDTRIIEQNVIL